MGNCWRMPEDHSGLLHIPPNEFERITTSSNIPTSNPYLTFTHPMTPLSDTTQIPKVNY